MFERIDPLRDAIGPPPPPSGRRRFLAILGVVLVFVAFAASTAMILGIVPRPGGPELEQLDGGPDGVAAFRTSGLDLRVFTGTMGLVATACLFVHALRTGLRARRWRAPAMSRRRRYRGAAALLILASALLSVASACVQRVPLRQEITVHGPAAEVSVDDDYLLRRPAPRVFAFAEIQSVVYEHRPWWSLQGPARASVLLTLGPAREVKISKGFGVFDLAAAIADSSGTKLLCREVYDRHYEPVVRECDRDVPRGASSPPASPTRRTAHP
ncbi:MAG: hypothetical protein O2895_02935 [Chloroflexi bacterium]|nr:hypothetical protein [Chloroflexota bacterium]